MISELCMIKAKTATHKDKQLIIKRIKTSFIKLTKQMVIDEIQKPERAIFSE